MFKRSASDNDRVLARAAYKFVASRVAAWRGEVDGDWQRKLAVCEGCPLRAAHGGVFYCGGPVWRRPTLGCGCPCRAKARMPGEHCPVDATFTPTADLDLDPGTPCPCKWCASQAPAPPPPPSPAPPSHRLPVMWAARPRGKGSSGRPAAG